MWAGVISAVEALRIDMAQICFNGVSFRVPEESKCSWRRREVNGVADDCHESVMSLDLPLLDDLNNYGVLYLKKDLLSDPMSRHTLGRIEHLRRSIVRKLEVFEKGARAVERASVGLAGFEISGESRASELKAVEQCPKPLFFTMIPHHSKLLTGKSKEGIKDAGDCVNLGI